MPPQDADFAEAIFAGATIGEAVQAATGNEAFDFGNGLVVYGGGAIGADRMLSLAAR